MANTFFKLSLEAITPETQASTVTLNEWYNRHKDAYKELRAQRDLRRLPTLPPPDQAGTVADPITLDGIIRSQSEQRTDKVRKAKRHSGDIEMAQADLTNGLGGHQAEAPEKSLIVIDVNSDSCHSINSVSKKRRYRRRHQQESSESAGSPGPQPTDQRDIAGCHSLTIRAEDLLQGTTRGDGEDYVYSESGSVVLSEDVALEEPITAPSIFELLHNSGGDDDHAEDSALTPCSSLIIKTFFRAGDRPGMAAATERTRRAMQKVSTDSEKIGESKKRVRPLPQEHALTMKNSKEAKKRTHISTTLLTSIRQKTLTDYVTVLRQPGDALIPHGGPSQQSDSDSLLLRVLPVRADCHASEGSETVLNFPIAEDSHLIKRTRTDPQRARSAASSNSLEYDKRVAFS